MICNDRGKLWVYLFTRALLFPGLTVRDFLGFPSLKEVECSGQSVKAEVELLSLTLYRQDNAILAILNTIKSTCKTFNEFSSCDLNEVDQRRSVLRTLVSHLEAGQTTVIGCNVTTFQEIGHAPRYSWSIPVYRESKCET